MKCSWGSGAQLTGRQICALKLFLPGGADADRNLGRAGLSAVVHRAGREGMYPGGQIGEGVLERLLAGHEQGLVADAKLDPVDLPVWIGRLHRRRYWRSVLLIERQRPDKSHIGRSVAVIRLRVVPLPQPRYLL